MSMKANNDSKVTLFLRQLFHDFVRVAMFPFTPRLVNAIRLEIDRKQDLLLRTQLGAQGERCFISPSATIHSPSSCRMGNHCYINDNVVVLARGGINIGNGVWIAAHSSLITTTHPSDVEFIGDCADIEHPIVIEDNVWIGTHAVILPNVRLGRSCIVAAGAIVTKDVPPYAIVGGVPARVMRYKTIRPETILDESGNLSSESVVT